MILANGIVYQSSEQERILEELEDKINHTRLTENLTPQTVIDAVDKLGKCIAEGEFDILIKDILTDDFGVNIQDIARLLSRENIEYKIKIELGEDFFTPKNTSPPSGLPGISYRAVPLGTLFHIAAGNADVLPAFTVAEGLLTGNVNILKLPQADNGLTLTILQKLIEIEPELKNFIYVFDTPSSDISAMKKMADMADGIVVWGGDSAVKAVRALASPGTKLIEWGHRLSFAYISGDWHVKLSDLAQLAEHIVKTEQLLCSSCQTIFINTDKMEDLTDFCRAFLPCLEEARRKYPLTDIGAAAEMTLKTYTAELERALNGDDNSQPHVFHGTQCSLTACEDSVLELSGLFGNCPVKRLPEKDMMSTLRAAKCYLQTAGLIADSEDSARLTDLLIRCGVNRIMKVGNMSDTFSGESHDGEYSLRRYVRIVNIDS